MVNINTSQWIKDGHHVAPPKTDATISKADLATSKPELKPRSAATTVSPLAQQLSDAAERAAVRDSTLNIGELAKTARSIINKISGRLDVYKRERFDAEIPKTDDVALLARAKQATAFINGKGANPFSGMSREQLALIIHDESGPFTINERNAAFLESGLQEERWNKAIVAKAQEANRRTGNSNGDGVALEILEHYRSLPLIEQAQYPADYEAQLLQLAAHASDDQENPEDWVMLLDKWAKARSSDDIAPAKATPTSEDNVISDALLQARIEGNK